MTTDFSKFLDVPVENIERPKPLPAGHFHAEVVSWKGADRDYKNGEPVVPVVEFTYRTIGPDDDVEEGLLPANGGVGVLCTYDYRLVPPNKDGRIEGGGQSAIRRFAEEGLHLDVKGLHLPDVMDAMKGSTVLLQSDPRVDKNDVPWTRILKVLPPR